MTAGALRNADIIQHIIEGLVNGERDCTTSEQRRWISSVSQVCKAFYTPAIKVLWTRLPSLIPLLSLLPEFRSSYRARIGSKSASTFQYHPSEPVSAVVWNRFKEHANLVKVLTQDRRVPAISGDVWSYLGDLVAGAPLLPNLRELRWEPTSSCEDLKVLASHSLTSLSLRCTWSTELGSEDIAVSALQDILASTPTLSSLTLTDFDSNFMAFLAPEALCHLENVSVRAQEMDRSGRKLWHSPGYGYPDANSLRTLSSLPELKRLQVDFKAERPGFDFKGFRSLTQLRITDHGGDVPAFLETCASPELRELILTSSGGAFSPGFSWRDMHAFCSNLARCAPHLQCLMLMFTSLRDVECSPEATLAALSPLLALRHLTNMTLWSVKEALGFSDSVLAAFAEAWPALISLSLCCHNERAFSMFTRAPQPEAELQEITLRSLVTFAEHCKELRTLRLPHLHIAAEEAVRLPTHSDHQLRVLGICRASVPDARACALTIGSLFPHLEPTPSFEESMCINSFASGSESSGWNGVLLALQDIHDGEVGAGVGSPPGSEA